MLINATILDETLAPVFEYHTEINPLRVFELVELADNAANETRQRGVEWSIDRIHLAGKQMVDAVAATPESNDTYLQTRIENIMVALWVHESLFTNNQTTSRIKTNFELKISPEGRVQSTSLYIEE